MDRKTKKYEADATEEEENRTNGYTDNYDNKLKK
jgi:hypothetical protein